MIAEGWSLALVAWCLSALALAFGVYRGIRSLIDPHWAQKLVRLAPDEPDERGGFAEFRATYGGLFFGLHAAALLLALIWIARGGALVGVMATGASAAIAAAWAGAAAGRALSMWRDGAATRVNLSSAALEAIVAIVVGAPWLLWSAAPH